MPGTFINYVVYSIAGSLVFWCIAIPVAIIFIAYLIGIAVMCTKELWRIREQTRKGASKHEKTDPSL